MNFDSLPNNVYYDANIINNDQSGHKPPPRLVFQDIRSTSLLTYPELYELSVVRFNLQSANSLPIWIPNIQLNLDYDPNITTYSFTITYDVNNHDMNTTYSSGQTFVEYIPTNLNEPVPKPTSTNDLYIPYYYVYSFDTIADMLNNALTEAFQRLGNDLSRIGIPIPTQNAPFFEWDSDSSKFILNGDVMGFDGRGGDHFSIYANTAMFTLMSGFKADYFGPSVSEGKNYRFKMTKETRGLNLFTISDTYSVIQLYQEYSSASLFTPVSSIVFCTSQIPVLASNTAKPTIFSGDGSLISTDNNNNISSMITDFESQDNNGYGFCGSLAYIPSSEYRMITMNSGSNEKLNNIDIIVYWKDQYSNLHPMYLLPGCKCDIKILFRKKKI